MKNIVTISREYGSGGYEVGRRVAERMNYKFYDKELIAHIADKFLIPESFVAATEETELKKKNIFHEGFPVFTRTENENADYIFREQGKFIVQLVEEGNCVIAGRRADYYLKDNPNALHLFFYADKDFKVRRICETENISEDEAVKKIADMDRRRRTSYEYVTGRTWGDMHNYDRLICTSTLGLDKCVEEILTLLG
ncbi:MAG: cytidylate kinase-like family protein [Oscillospiraceae bacterium]|nr:cytidylate kinase-like family protein [Oscillospiraceae bacterium]